MVCPRYIIHLLLPNGVRVWTPLNTILIAGVHHKIPPLIHCSGKLMDL